MPAMRVEPKARLPKKERGKHRWIVLATYVVSEEAADISHNDPEGNVLLDNENLWDISTGCIDCEETYQMIRAIPCPAPEWKPNA